MFCYGKYPVLSYNDFKSRFKIFYKKVRYIQRICIFLKIIKDKKSLDSNSLIRRKVSSSTIHGPWYVVLKSFAFPSFLCDSVHSSIRQQRGCDRRPRRRLTPNHVAQLSDLLASSFCLANILWLPQIMLGWFQIGRKLVSATSKVSVPMIERLLSEDCYWK